MAASSFISSKYLVSRKYLEEYPDPSDLNQELIDEINGGALLVNYVGHGAEDFWADEEIFGACDVDSLQNGPRYPLVVAMTCLNGYFAEAFAGWESLAEVLMKSPDKGAVAMFTSTGMTTPGEQALLDGGLFQALFKKGKKQLGRAISHGKLNLLESSAGGEDVVRTFMLFGDPAMEMKVQSLSGSAGFPSSGGSGSGGGCFIATAAYGSYAERHVMVLRKFRDQYLAAHEMGKSVISLYYRFSPPIADLIHRRGNLKSLTRVGLSPLVALSTIFTRLNLAERWPLFVAIFVILSVLLYMEMLIRGQRRPTTKTTPSGGASRSSSK
jgi:hypothetical protein